MIKCYNIIHSSMSTTQDVNKIYFGKMLPGEKSLKLPCGKCTACRLNYAREWAIRGEKELRLHDHNYFVTLTYNDQHLGENNLQKREVQLYLKKLRNKYGKNIRYMACGEYGEKSQRAHYHLILYNMPPISDLSYYKTHEGNQYYTSEEMDKLWQNRQETKGFTVITQATFETIAYVARYITKKINGKNSDNHYARKSDGLILNKEFMLMSRRPGIGHGYLEKYSNEMFNTLTVPTTKGEMGIPRYYKKKLKLLDKERYEQSCNKIKPKSEGTIWEEKQITEEIAKREQKFEKAKALFFNQLKGRIL